MPSAEIIAVLSSTPQGALTGSSAARPEGAPDAAGFAAALQAAGPQRLRRPTMETGEPAGDAAASAAEPTPLAGLVAPEARQRAEPDAPAARAGFLAAAPEAARPSSVPIAAGTPAATPAPRDAASVRATGPAAGQGVEPATVPGLTAEPPKAGTSPQVLPGDPKAATPAVEAGVSPLAPADAAKAARTATPVAQAAAAAPTVLAAGHVRPETLGRLGQMRQIDAAEALGASARQAVSRPVAPDPPAVITPLVDPEAPVGPEAGEPPPPLTVAARAGGAASGAPASPTPSAAATSPSAPPSAGQPAEAAAPRVAADPAPVTDVEAPPTPAPLPATGSTQAAAAPAASPAAHAPLSQAPLEAVAQIAAQIVRRLEGRTTRFDVQLNPAELGRVDVRLEIDAEGRLAARLAFDNPAAAADLRARADELRRGLEEAGFQLADDAFSFTERERDERRQPPPWTHRAFAEGAETADLADLAAAPTRRLAAAGGLDLRI